MVVMTQAPRPARMRGSSAVSIRQYSCTISVFGHLYIPAYNGKQLHLSRRIELDIRNTGLSK